MTTNYLRARSRRWTSADVVAATERLEKAFAKDKTARAIASMHKANLARGATLLPVEPSEAQVLPIERDRTPRKSRKSKDAVRRQDWSYEPFGGFSFRLPWAPSVNQAYANKAGIGRVKVKRARLFAEAAHAEMMVQGVPRSKYSRPLALTFIQHAPSCAGDCSNLVKAAEDALVSYGLIADDNREIVKRITVIDGERCKTPWIEVKIECLRTEGER